MPELKEETTTTTHTHQTKWWSSLLTPQLVIGLGVVLVNLVVFWVSTQNTIKDVSVIENVLPTKVDEKDFNALEGRVTRQYEQFNKISERLTAVEKEAEYNRGLHDAMEQLKSKK